MGSRRWLPTFLTSGRKLGPPRESIPPIAKCWRAPIISLTWPVCPALSPAPCARRRWCCSICHSASGKKITKRRKPRPARARYVRMRQGTEPLSGPGEHNSAHQWWLSRTRAFGPWDLARQKIAVLNIGAYHSRTFEDAALLAALPSSRVSLDWAQSVLFKQAEAGERVVICMRATKFWGLTQGRKYGHSLYAPLVTRGGHMTRADPRREEAIAAARAAISCDSNTNS